MHGHRHPGPGDDARQPRHVVLVGVHAARRQQPDQMAGAAAGFEGFGEAPEDRALLQGAVGQRGVNAHQILHHHPAGADVHVADLGIAHLAGRQPDVGGGGVKERVGALGHEAVPGRRRGQGDGVVVGLGAHPPAVQDTQHDGPGRRPLGVGFRHGANICRNRPPAIVGRGASP